MEFPNSVGYRKSSESYAQKPSATDILRTGSGETVVLG